MKSRALASVAIAAAVVAGLSACNLAAPQATQKVYDPSDGVSAHLDDVVLRNIIVLSNGEEASLVFTGVNNGAEASTVSIDYSSSLDPVTATLDPGAMESFGTEQNDAIELPGLHAAPGSNTTITFSIAGASDEATVPVLDGALHEYSTIAPTPTAGAEETTPAAEDAHDDEDSGH
ncbi:hypothetical protein [Mycetocola reblochoni]|uniref:DNA modification methylase n=2 Tax=Mycetocola reblochoni TaxID=331618 RepID=A0A1R4JR85_9MICO|nr:hypothetical protein [Mycetocola reblochoni]RLP69307.1 hypothetical protein D9V30_08345 [Mycetocola reblochoni]SJN34295.1 hypothetical protein FM119_08905 [Mycetocola reblochoni REB411]